MEYLPCVKRYPLAAARRVRERETEQRAELAANAVEERVVAQERLAAARSRVEATARLLEGAIRGEDARADDGERRASDYTWLESFRCAMEQRLSVERADERAAQETLLRAIAAEDQARSALKESRVFGQALEHHESRFRMDERRVAEERSIEEALALPRGPRE